MATKKPLGQGCVAVADPGEGPGPPLPLFLDQTEKIWEGGGEQALPPYFKVWIWHCVASVEENKVAEHFMHFVIKK